MDDQPEGAGAGRADEGLAAGAAPESGSGAEGKECVFCGEAIPVFADRCSHCSGFLPIAEGRAFSQHFLFFVCCLAMFLGTLLPWEGAWMDSYGWRSIGGAFLLVFAGYGMVASYFNIFHRRMIVWPAIFAALDGAYIGWRRVFQLFEGPGKSLPWDTKDLFHVKQSLAGYFHLFGPGLYLVVIFSTLFWIIFVVGVVQGGRASAARREAEKAARAAKKPR